MALHGGKPSGPSGPLLPDPKPEKPYTCEVPLATQDTYKPSGADDRAPMPDPQLLNMLNGDN